MLLFGCLNGAAFQLKAQRNSTGGRARLRRASQARWKRDLAAFLLSLAERGILHALGQAQSPIQETKRDKFARDGPGRGIARLPIMPYLVAHSLVFCFACSLSRDTTRTRSQPREPDPQEMELKGSVWLPL